MSTKEFAERLLDLRVESGMHQTELGLKCGVTQTMIAKYETGRAKPRRRIAIALAKALNVDVDWLVTGNGSSVVDTTSTIYRMKSIGCNTVMPVILRELHAKKLQGVDVDLAEAYMLLNDTQALYITLLTKENNLYYQHIEPTIRAVLDKYGLLWVLSPVRLSEYCTQFLVAMEFRSLKNGFWSAPHLVPDALRDTYASLLIKAILEEAPYDALVSVICESYSIEDLEETNV